MRLHTQEDSSMKPFEKLSSRERIAVMKRLQVKKMSERVLSTNKADTSKKGHPITIMDGLKTDVKIEVSIYTGIVF